MPSPAEQRARLAFAAFTVALAAAGAGWYLLDQGRHDLYEISTHDSVSGLIAGAPVEFHGVEVGQVRRVDLLDPRTVRVVLEVRKDVPVTSATVATITGRGLAARGFTGYVFVGLEETAAGGRPLVAKSASRHPEIATAPSQTASLDTSIGQLNDSVQGAMVLLRTTLDPQTIASLKQSAANLATVTQALAEDNERLRTTLADAQRAAAQMPALVRSGTQAFDALQAQVLPRAQGTLAQMDAVLASSQAVTESLRTELLPQVEQTATRLDDVSASLADTSDRIRRNPSILVRGAAPRPGPGERP